MDNIWRNVISSLLLPTAEGRAVIGGNWIVIIGGYSHYYNRHAALHEIQLFHILEYIYIFCDANLSNNCE